MREEVTEVPDTRFMHTRESRHPDKCGSTACLQEEDPPVKIGQDWNYLAV